MDLVVSPTGGELGPIVEAELAAGGAEAGDARVLINIGLQTPNTLLHDGRAWRSYAPATIVAETRSMLDSEVAREAGFIVHASYAFLHAVDEGARPGDRLGPIAQAALEAEQLVLGGDRPACVVRLGYLYGPTFRDLKAYRTAFRLGRPYWAGPPASLLHHLHSADAARALVLAGQERPDGETLYATDDEAASFGSFMDYFARRIGNPLPWHLPSFSRRFVHGVVAEEHMQMVELGVSGAARPRPAAFVPHCRDYRDGLDEVVARWRR